MNEKVPVFDQHGTLIGHAPLNPNIKGFVVTIVDGKPAHVKKVCDYRHVDYRRLRTP